MLFGAASRPITCRCSSYRCRIEQEDRARGYSLAVRNRTIHMLQIANGAKVINSDSARPVSGLIRVRDGRCIRPYG